MAHRSLMVSALFVSLASLAATACGGSDDAANANNAESTESDLSRASLKVTRTDLVSDRPGAVTQDPNLKNPWGMAFNAMGGVWVSNNHSSTSTVYSTEGKLLLTVTVAGASDTTGGGAPTGQVFNTTSDFAKDAFIFSDEGGIISGWAPGTPGAVLRADQSASKASYKGLAQAEHQLFATDFHNGKVDVFDATYAKVATAGFVDASIPKGYAPFNIQLLDGKLYVTYAQQDAQAADNTDGPGKGFVNVFETDGTLIGRVATRGALNAPWGLSIAPSTFGKLAGKLLVGNFGDGAINAYDVAFATETSGGGYGSPGTTVTTVKGKHLGALVDGYGTKIAIPGLWGLAFSPVTGDLFFTAGPNDENNGLFGKLSLAK